MPRASSGCFTDMIAQLIAIGVFGASPGSVIEVGTVIATPERTVIFDTVQSTASVGLLVPLGAPRWQQPFDPADHAPYAGDFVKLLGASEKIATVEMIALSSSAAALGIIIDQTEGYMPIIDTAGKKVQLWFTVDPELWGSAAFNAAGVQMPVSMRILTNSAPPKRFERTAVLTVRQL